jgi:ubiquinone/menaquinone biosynthesis C-methylase UbiE
MSTTVSDLAEAVPGAAALRRRSYEVLALPPGSSVVDVGCGTGCAVAELAERGARPVGVDLSGEVIAVARRRWPGLDLRVGDAYRLPLADASVAGYRADKVFHELADPGRALAEAARVLTTGGTAVLVGQDWDTVVIDADDRVLTRAIVHARADRVTEPWAARRYRNLLVAAGFTEPTVEVHTAVLTDPAMLPVPLGLATAAVAAGAVPGEEADAWVREQRVRAGEGRMFVAVPMFLAAARKGRRTQ